MTKYQLVTCCRSGAVPVDFTASIVPSAHSCASAATITVKPRAPLAPGEYTLAGLLDLAKWPAVWESDVVTWRGHAASLRRYRVT